MQTQIVRHGDAETFLRHARPWLMITELENNLILGIAELFERQGTTEDVYYATVEHAGSVVGCALRTGRRKLLLTRVPPSCVGALVADAAACFTSLPAVMGPLTAAHEFARQWARVRGCSVVEEMAQRIYGLQQVRPPARMPGGAMRSAEPADEGLIASWLALFANEIRHEPLDTRAAARSLITGGSLVLWWDGQPRTLAGYSGRTPNGVRIGYVYTPPEWRGRGYASACVAALSQRALDNGAKWCCLYADLANPASNAIYRRIGYEPVGDSVELRFVPAAGSRE